MGNPDTATTPVEPLEPKGSRRGSTSGDDRRTQARAQLDAARAGRGEVPRDLHGLYLAEIDLGGLDLHGVDLSDANLTRAKLTGANLFGANLEGAVMTGCQLDRAELTGARLTRAHLENASACHAGFGQARLAEANLFHARLEGATFAQADLTRADLRCSDLTSARMLGTRCLGTDFTQATLRHGDLQEADVAGATFDRADLRSARLCGLKNYAAARFISTDVRDVDFTGAHFARRFILDQNYLHEFRAQGRLQKILYGIWWATSDCGRSLARWSLFTALLALLFALAYQTVDVDFGPYRTWFSPVYFSFVTLTTLGYGDCLPISATAQIVATLEVICGYVMLGGLLSILTNKMARRAE